VFRHYLRAAFIMGIAGSARTAAAQQRYLALGDSYTIGEGVPDTDRWPNQLVRALRSHGRSAADAEIVAKTGWTTDELDAAITQHDPKGPYDLVTLLIGVNNQYRGRSVEEFRTQLRALVARAIAFARNDARRVVIVGIPDWGVTPFNTARDAAQVAREIDAFNAVNREEAARAGAAWVDITDLTRASPRDVVADGLHPSAAMYAKWVERATPLAERALSSASRH
jgi:lysophospholipase L1-like esterase